MIDIANIVFTRVATKVRESRPDAFVSGGYVRVPPSFPAASLVEMGNTTRVDTIDSGSNENYANVMYEANVYSNKITGGYTECREILALIDEEMLAIGFIRIMFNPIPNENDSTVYRMMARYEAAVSNDHKIFRR